MECQGRGNRALALHPGGQTARPLHAVAQLTFQIAGARERNSAERTSRSPCGPVTDVGVAGPGVAVLVAGTLLPGVPGAVVGAAPPSAAR